MISLLVCHSSTPSSSTSEVKSFSMFKKLKGHQWKSIVSKKTASEKEIDVQINIGLMAWNEKQMGIKPKRGKRLALKVSNKAPYKVILQKAEEKWKAFHSDLYDETEQYVLVFESGNEAQFLPGTSAIGSDHHLVCTVVKLRLSKQTAGKKRCRVKYDTARLRNEEVLRRFNVALQNRYQVLENEETAVEESEEVEQDFEVMKKAYTEVAESVLGRPRKKKKPWISEESWSLIDQREEINRKILGTRSERVKKQLRAKYAEKNREVKRSIKTDRKKWMEKITCEAEEAAGNQHMKTLYGLTKILCNEKPKQSTAVFDKKWKPSQ